MRSARKACRSGGKDGSTAAAEPAWPACASLLGMALLLSGCGTDAAEARWEGTVDTLANGTVEVRSPAVGLWPEGEGWRLVEELRIGSLDGEGPEVFGQVTDVAADGAGRIYVLDGQAAELRAFGPDGAHLWTAGGQGEGPGELSRPAGLAIREDGVWVVDPGNSRYTVFDTAGAFVDDHPRNLMGPFGGWKGGVDPGGRLYDSGAMRLERESSAGGFRFATVFLVVDEAAEPGDTVELPTYRAASFDPVTMETSAATMRFNPPVPFTARLVTAFDPAGYFWAAVTEDYRLHRLTPDGDTVRVVARAYEPVAVGGEERDSVVARLREQLGGQGNIEASRIPETKPPFEAVTAAPDGHLWVLTAAGRADTLRTYDVFDPEGRYLGAVPSPDRIRPSPHFQGEKVYGYLTDELDVPFVVRWRIEKPGG